MKTTVANQKPVQVPVENMEVTVIRQGAKLILPVDITYDAARLCIDQLQKSEQQVVAIHNRIRCYPLDGMVAISMAMEQIYGFADAKERESFFGNQPPLRINVQTGVDTFRNVAYGKVAPPTWDGGFINIMVDGDYPMSLVIHGNIRRRFEDLMQQLLDLTRNILATQSIYRGRALAIDLAFTQGEDFNPEKHAPVFLDTTQPVTLILPKEVEEELHESIWDMITTPDRFRNNNIPVKHGVLLDGVFGTGKSLTAKRTAQICAEHGFTFFYLKCPSQFVAAYELAMLYAPAVLFVEDVDSIFGGERDDEMNSYLEALDGVVAKGSEVICVFTTNFPDKINKAFLRPGRVDTEITLGPLDAGAASRFIQSFAPEFLAGDINWEVVGEAFTGLVASDITEGVNKAKRRAIGVFGSDIHGKLTTGMLQTFGNIMQKRAQQRADDGTTQDTRDLEAIRKSLEVVQHLMNK